MNYIGSKHSIIDFLEESICDFTKNSCHTFCDIFAGTCIVAKRFKMLGYSVIANDIQYYSYVLSKHFIENNKSITFTKLKQEGIENVFDYLNKLSYYHGPMYNLYTYEGTFNKKDIRKYFTASNAIKIDSIRDMIEKMYKKDKITKQEYYYLLASLLESADKVANTASVYEAFLKKFKKSAEKELELKPVDIVINNDTTNQVYIEDANDLIDKLEGDILYLDPPYNARKYSSNYHILETIAYGDYPEVKGVTGIRRNLFKSDFNSKNNVLEAFENIIKKAKFKYIFLSYNDEGLMSITDIEKIMSKYGIYKRYEHNHKRYKAKRDIETTKKTTIEYLHALEKRSMDE